jgi:YegS/Rv2252/BmrU family lipid kinase
LNEVVNGIFTQEICSTKEIFLGIIPVGTGNDWGRMFGIPLDYEGSVSIIREFRIMLHDIGVIKYSTGNEIEKRYFINIAGLGFDAMVVKRTNAQKDKGKSGKLIYFYNLLMSLLSYKNTAAEINIDGKKFTCEAFTISIGNGKYSGGGMKQTPDAIPDDGLLNLTLIKKMGKAEIIFNLKKLYDGTILSHPKIEGHTGKNIFINSDPVMNIQADGESLGQTPVDIGLVPQSINVIYGTKFTR